MASLNASNDAMKSSKASVRFDLVRQPSASGRPCQAHRLKLPVIAAVFPCSGLMQCVMAVAHDVRASAFAALSPARHPARAASAGVSPWRSPSGFTARQPSIPREPAFEFVGIVGSSPPLPTLDRLRRARPAASEMSPPRSPRDRPPARGARRSSASFFARTVRKPIDSPSSAPPRISASTSRARPTSVGQPAAHEQPARILLDLGPHADRLVRIVLEQHADARRPALAQRSRKRAALDHVLAEIDAPEQAGIAGERSRPASTLAEPKPGKFVLIRPGARHPLVLSQHPVEVAAEFVRRYRCTGSFATGCYRPMPSAVRTRA